MVGPSACYKDFIAVAPEDHVVVWRAPDFLDLDNLVASLTLDRAVS
jgi:hypothetical protein